MTSLRSKQRAHLRSLAHSLKPILQVGSEGVSDALLHSVEEAFHTRELMKVKVQRGASTRAREVADEIVARLAGVEVVQTIGRTIALYRPFPEKPEIPLPE